MSQTLDAVRGVLVETLELSTPPEDLQPDTALFGAVPELDSFGVVQLVAALEDTFGIVVEDDEFGADIFETVGSLTDFVEAKLRAQD
jgi:acyl carrier protein